MRAEEEGADQRDATPSFELLRRSARVLVLDHDPVVLVHWRQALMKAGYVHITTVDQGRDVLQAFRRFSPDLVVLDVDLPEHEGWAVLEDLQYEIGQKTYLPVIVSSERDTSEARLRSLLLGAADFCQKPLDQVEALLRIRLRLETRSRFLELARENLHLRTAAFTPPRS